MRRYLEHAGNVFGATIVHAMWRDALTNAQVISRRDRGAEPAGEDQGQSSTGLPSPD
jgi:hypothetical protein